MLQLLRAMILAAVTLIGFSPAALAAQEECRDLDARGTILERSSSVLYLALEQQAGTTAPPPLRLNLTNTTRIRYADDVEIGPLQIPLGVRADVRYCDGSKNALRVDLLVNSPLLTCGAEYEIAGRLGAIMEQPLRVVVNEVAYPVSSLTTFRDEENRAVTLNFFRVGDMVEVKACDTTGGQKRLLRLSRHNEVSGEEDGDLPEIRLAGPAREIDAATQSFQIFTAKIMTNGATRYHLHDSDATASFADITPGVFVKVNGVPAPQIAIFPPPPPAFIAHEIEIYAGEIVNPPPPPSPDRFVTRGFLRAVQNETTIVVGDRVISVNAETRIYDRGTTSVLTLVDLIPGDFLEVAGTRTSTALTAQTIVRTTPVGRPVRFHGSIAAVDGNLLRIGERTVSVTEETVLLLANGAAATLADLTVGRPVQVEGQAFGETRVVAERIQLRELPRPECVRNTRFENRVREKGVDRLVVGENIVLVRNTTEIRDREGRPATLASIQLNDILRVEGESLPTAGALNVVGACEIRILRDNTPEPEQPTRIVGRIDAISTETLTFAVRDITVVTNAETRYRVRRDDVDTTPTFADLMQGDLVEVRGNRLADGRFAARIVRILEDRTPPAPEPIRERIAGLITALDLPGSLTIGDVAVTLAPGVEVRGYGSLPVRLNDLSVGDNVIAKGQRLPDSTTIVVREIEVRASLITDISLTSSTLTVSNNTVIVTTGTLVLETGSEAPIAFADLAIGDLVRVRGVRLAPRVFRAVQIVRLNTVNFTGEIGDYTPTIPSIEDGLPGLETSDNTNTYGSIGLPEDSLPVEPDTIYEVTVRVTANVPAAVVPGIRLRANNQSFLRAFEYIVDSNGPASYSPTAEGRILKFYFAPAQLPRVISALVDDWFASLDVMNFDPQNAAVARLGLRGITVRPIHLSRFQVVETLVDQSFETGAEGWTFRPLAGFTAPVANSGTAGSIDLVPPAMNSIGWWTGQITAIPEANALYRARFFVRSGSTDASKVPTFRLRLNTASLQLSGILVVTSSRGGEDSPTVDGRSYDVYLWVPAPLAAGEGIFPSIDLVHVQSDDEASPISLERYTLERLTIAEE